MVDENHPQKDLYTADENRLFTVGKIIRRLKIDEIPQLINVIKGKCVTRYDYIKTGLSDRYNAIEVYVVCGTKVSRLLL